MTTETISATSLCAMLFIVAISSLIALFQRSQLNGILFIIFGRFANSMYIRGATVMFASTEPQFHKFNQNVLSNAI